MLCAYLVDQAEFEDEGGLLDVTCVEHPELEVSYVISPLPALMILDNPSSLFQQL